jgi:hypothetical protein
MGNGVFVLMTNTEFASNGRKISLKTLNWLIIIKYRRFLMSRRFEITLEYDGEDPIRNTFLCEIDELYYSVLRDYEDLYGIKSKYSHKKESVKTSEMSDYFMCLAWGTKEIAEKIESIKKEMELDTELEGKDKEFLNEVISDLQRLYDIAVEKCNENNISPENLYINWWIDC